MLIHAKAYWGVEEKRSMRLEIELQQAEEPAREGYGPWVGDRSKHRKSEKNLAGIEKPCGHRDTGRVFLMQSSENLEFLDFVLPG